MVSTSCADSYPQIKRAELVQSGVKQATFANVGVGFIPILQRFKGDLILSPFRGVRGGSTGALPWRMGINPTPTLGSAARFQKNILRASERHTL